jgi:hypothetical protein
MSICLRRREFIAGLGGAMPVIGFLGGSTAVAQRCDRISLGEGHNERYADIATEFVRLKVDVIVTSGGAQRSA